MYLTKSEVKNWKQINYRNVDSMLSVQFIYDLYDQYDAKINWFRFKNVCLYFQDGKLWSYTPLSDWENAVGSIASQFKDPIKSCNPNIIKNSSNYCLKKKNLLHKVLKEIQNTNLQQKGKIELFNLLFNWYQATLNQIYYINVAPLELGLQKAIDDLCVEHKVSSYDRGVLYSLDENTEVIKEELDLLRSVIDNGFKIDEDIINKHYDEFKHITIGYGSNQMNYDELCERYKNTIAMNRDDVINKFKEIETYGETIQIKKKESEDNINNKHLAKLFRLASKLGVLRDKNKALLGKAVYYRNMICCELAKQCDVSYEEFKYYLLDEIESLVLQGEILSVEEIARRKEGIYISSISTFVSGETAKENYYCNVGKKEGSCHDLRVLRGICASTGKTRGIVKVCLSSEECKKLQENEILVTYGTDFNYLDAMVRSAAIITEEGGILSHASVISRELKKPCIIGFKEITKILKDGDEIEIDADNGIVKFVSREEKSMNDDLPNGVYSLKSMTSAGEVGNKAYNLMLLNQKGFNVPDGMVLGVSFFKELLMKQKMLDIYLKYAQNLEKYEEKIKALIDKVDLSCIKLEEFLDFNKFTYAVRSSSPSEDGDNKSFAGQFVAELFCNSTTNVEQAIKKCWKSFLNKGIEVYADKLENCFGGIVIQRMINARYAGVMFTKNPVAKDDSMVIECCLGVASKLVDNKVDPNRYYINKETMKIKKDFESFEIEENKILEIANIGLQVEEYYNQEMDVEWAYEGEELFVIQSRPITT